jgi:hypothetical protein
MESSRQSEAESGFRERLQQHSRREGEEAQKQRAGPGQAANSISEGRYGADGMIKVLNTAQTPSAADLACCSRDDDPRCCAQCPPQPCLNPLQDHLQCPRPGRAAQAENWPRDNSRVPISRGTAVPLLVCLRGPQNMYYLHP